VAYLLEHGKIGEGEDLVRVCGNPLCVNPEHIVVGKRGRKGSGSAKVLKERREKEYPGQILSLDDIPGFAVSRFSESVVVRGENDCWGWSGGISAKGYGRFAFYVGGGKQRHMSAHRMAYLIKHGSIPEGLVLRHSCDNKLCMNPAHLLAGSDAENAADRSLRQPDSWVRLADRLDDELLANIRADMAGGVSLGRLVNRYNLSAESLRKIRDGGL